MFLERLSSVSPQSLVEMKSSEEAELTEAESDKLTCLFSGCFCSLMTHLQILMLKLSAPLPLSR